MPFTSEKQRRFLYATNPTAAKKIEDDAEKKPKKKAKTKPKAKSKA
jgi:hypothetical protein